MSRNKGSFSHKPSVSEIQIVKKSIHKDLKYLCKYRESKQKVSSAQCKHNDIQLCCITCLG
jgi:hypothetical protein